MHTVFRFLEYDRLLAFEYLVGNLHILSAEFCAHFLTNGGVKVVERGKTVHKYCILACLVHNLLGYCVGGESSYSLCPDLYRLAHRNPHVSVDNVCALDCFVNAFGKGKGCAAFLCNSLALSDKIGVGEVLLGCADYEIESHLCASYHKGVTHIVSCIAHIYELCAL